MSWRVSDEKYNTCCFFLISKFSK